MNILSMGILATCSTLAFLYLLLFCYKGPSIAKSSLKTASTAGLVLIAVLQFAPWPLTLGLLCCSLGDYFLSRDGERQFLAGVGAFALGHVFFIVLFLSFGFGVTVGTYGIVLILIAACAAFILWPRTGDLRWPVMSYVVIITSMGIVAFNLTGALGLPVIVTGAVLFVISDFVLSLEMFVLKKDSTALRVTPFIVWMTYWLALALILTGTLIYGITG